MDRRATPEQPDDWTVFAECAADVAEKVEQGWSVNEACDLWFPIHRSYDDPASRAALRICNGYGDRPACLVRADCLNFAIEQGIGHGIWGGKTPQQRDAIARRRRRRVVV